MYTDEPTTMTKPKSIPVANDSLAELQARVNLPALQTVDLEIEVSPARRIKLLTRVAEFYHRSFLNRSEGLRYLTKERGIHDVGLLKNFQIGYADGSLIDALPDDTDSLRDLKFLGVITQSGGELFEGCVVFPLYSVDGAVVNLYGRKIQDSALNHLYLPGPKVGLWNVPATRRTKTIVLAESVIDTLTALDAGITNVMPAYGAHGLTAEHLSLFTASKIETILIAFGGDEAGRAGAQKTQAQLIEKSIDVGLVQLPDGEDINSFLRSHPVAELQSLIQAALPEFVPALPQAIPITQVPQLVEGFEATAHGFRGCFAGRCYEVKGIAKETTQLKATIKAWSDSGKGFELNTLDMYSSRSRDAFAKSCAALFGVEDKVTKSDLQQLLNHMETLSNKEEEEASEAIVISPEDQARGLAFLNSPDLFAEILRDFETLGISGEANNKLATYLAATSRRLSDPISVLVQSRSASGKSTLLESVVSLIPNEDKRYLTRLTTTSLFYHCANELTHKLIAIEEAEGLGEAAYSLRALQSAKRLTVAVTVKDPASGKMKTEQYEVEGPVAVLMTTTSANLDEETASRFLVITIDESREMTERILETQRHRDTLSGYLAELDKNTVIEKHHAAQRLLEPVIVINPYAPQLSFPSYSLRARRDHKKYLMLIKAVTFLHQKQRQIKQAERGGQQFTYIEVTREDIRLANQLAREVLATSMDELSAPARKLFNLISELVNVESTKLGIELAAYSFNRRALREATSWTEWQVRTHLDELVNLEYVRAKVGGQGKEYTYELIAYPGPTQSARFNLVLTDPDSLQESAA
jgi:DNA primase